MLTRFRVNDLFTLNNLTEFICRKEVPNRFGLTGEAENNIIFENAKPVAVIGWGTEAVRNAFEFVKTKRGVLALPEESQNALNAEIEFYADFAKQTEKQSKRALEFARASFRRLHKIFDVEKTKSITANDGETFCLLAPRLRTIQTRIEIIDRELVNRLQKAA